MPWESGAGGWFPFLLPGSRRAAPACVGGEPSPLDRGIWLDGCLVSWFAVAGALVVVVVVVVVVVFVVVMVVGAAGRASFPSTAWGAAVSAEEFIGSRRAVRFVCPVARKGCLFEKG